MFPTIAPGESRRARNKVLVSEDKIVFGSGINKMLSKNRANFRVFHLWQKHNLIEANQHSKAKERKFANWSHANTNEEGVTAFLEDNASLYL